MQDDALYAVHAAAHGYAPRPAELKNPAAFTQREDERRILWISNLQHELRGGGGGG